MTESNVEPDMAAGADAYTELIEHAKGLPEGPAKAEEFRAIQEMIFNDEEAERLEKEAELAAATATTAVGATVSLKELRVDANGNVLMPSESEAILSGEQNRK
jgi:hypothetical protein